MANDFTGATFAIAGQIVFSAFLKRLISILSFSTDIEPTKAKHGTAVTVPLISAPGAALDLQNDHSGVRSAGSEDTTSAARTVTFNQQPIKGFHLSDEEVMQIDEGLLPLILQTRMEDCGYAVANNVLNYIFNLITAANFANVAHTGLAGNFDLDATIDINAVLANAGWPVDIPGRIAMILKPSLRANLKKDNAIQDASAFGGDVARTGQLEQVDIFKLFQSSTLPPAGGTPASENLTGFVSMPPAIAFAQRTVEPQHPEKLMHFDVIVDEPTGISLCYRIWYDEDKGIVYYSFETLYGASLGNGDALQRIRSAA